MTSSGRRASFKAASISSSMNLSTPFTSEYVIRSCKDCSRQDKSSILSFLTDFTFSE